MITGLGPDDRPRAVNGSEQKCCRACTVVYEHSCTLGSFASVLR